MTARVTFTEGGARRIVAAVRSYERGTRDQPAIKFRQPGDEGGGAIRLARANADWGKDQTQEVTLIYESSCDDEESGSGSKTIEAWNRLWPIKSNALVEIAQAVNGCWYVVAATSPGDSSGCDAVAIGGQDLTALDGYDDTTVQVLGHDHGCLRWFNTTNCGSGSGS